MSILYGTGTYGRVDEITGTCYVATRFVHVGGLPIYPLGSQLIAERSDRSARRIPIALSYKSAIAGWLRATLALGGIALTGLTVWLAARLFTAPPSIDVAFGAALALIATLTAFLAYFESFRFSRPSMIRKAELLHLLQWPRGLSRDTGRGR